MDTEKQEEFQEVEWTIVIQCVKEGNNPPIYMGPMSQDHLLEEGLGEIKLRKRHINSDKGKGKKNPLSLYPLIPLQIPWIQMRPKKLINK